MNIHPQPTANIEQPPTKLCECGCGLPSPINRKTATKYGRIKGQPARFIKGHSLRIVPHQPKQPAYEGPVKLCGCGCGKPTPIAKVTIHERGQLAGHPTRFLEGHYNRKTIAPEERYWRNVIKGAAPDDCWSWAGSKMSTGYGIVSGVGPKKRHVGAHRFSYELHKGPIPKGYFVCHTCDNPPCTNPLHLFAGTHQQNMDDCKRKGRISYNTSKGWHNKRSRLTNEDDKTICVLYSQGRTIGELASQYKVGKTTIYRILANNTP